MDCNLKLSVIIPVFNVSAYIERCAHSLMQQTMREGIEFLFIDDCTPDDSMEKLQQVICQYPLRRNQVRIIEMEHNYGQAAVRSRGIKEARGEYVIHCDSDDWVEPEMYETLVKKAIETNADIVSSAAYVHSKEGVSIQKEPYDEVDGQTVMKNLWKNPCLSVALWNKIVRRSIFIDNQILPFGGINVGEDSGLMLRAFYHAKKIVCLENAFYHYDLTRESSISHRKKEERWMDAKKVITKVDEYYQKMPDYKDFRLGLSFLKFQFKTDFVFDKDNYGEWKKTFPEVNRDILKFRLLPLKTRLVYLYYCYA